MYQNYGSEVKDLRAEYRFGTESSVAPERQANTVEQTAPQEPMAGDDVYAGAIAGDSDQVIAPGSPANYANSSAFSPQENMFGAVEDTPAQTTGGGFQVINLQQDAGVSPAAPPPEKHKKVGVLKETLGIGKKSTKGKTPEEVNRMNLEQRWKNALAEEERLNALEASIQNREFNTEQMNLVPNFPPKILCIHPLVHHSISSDIIPERQATIKVAFFNWIAVCVLLVCNAGISIGVTFAKGDGARMNKALMTVLCLVYLIGIPLSFVIWYWRMYSASFERSPPQHMVALCGLLIALALAIFAFIGPTSYGFSGIVFAIFIGKHRQKGVVAPVAVMTVFWLFEAVVVCYLIVMEFRYWRKDLALRRRLHREAKERATAAVGQ